MSSIRSCVIIKDDHIIFTSKPANNIYGQDNIKFANENIKYFNSIEIITDIESGERITAICRGPYRLFCCNGAADAKIAKSMLLELFAVISTEQENVDKLHYVYNFYRDPIEHIRDPEIGPTDTILFSSIMPQEKNETSSLLGSVSYSDNTDHDCCCCCCSNTDKIDWQKRCDQATYTFLAMGMSIVFGLCIAAIIIAFG